MQQVNTTKNRASIGTEIQSDSMMTDARSLLYNISNITLALQWLSGALRFKPSFVVADRLVIQNRQLLAAAMRFSVARVVIILSLVTLAIIGANAQRCGSTQDYVPDTSRLDDTPIRYVRINLHVILSDKSENNFDEVLGNEFLTALIDIANYKLRVKTPMNLPLGNTLANVPCRYQYKLTTNIDDANKSAIYYNLEHNPQYAYYNSSHTASSNIFSSYWYDTYGVNKGEEINIFFFSHHPDSALSVSYSAKDQGVGTSAYVLMANAFQLYSSNIAKGQSHNDALVSAAAVTANVLNHEIGHSLGLAHTWNCSDGCDDTPMNPGCWYSGDALHPCSNNMMDYNAAQSAITPCQLSIIHSNFANKTSAQYRLLDPIWCNYNDTQKIIIYPNEHIVWNASKDLECDIIVRNNASLEIKCIISLPKNAKIVLYKNSKLILNGGTITNSCQQKWKGIVYVKKKQSKNCLVLLNGGKIENNLK